MPRDSEQTRVDFRGGRQVSVVTTDTVVHRPSRLYAGMHLSLALILSHDRLSSDLNLVT